MLRLNKSCCAYHNWIGVTSPSLDPRHLLLTLRNVETGQKRSYWPRQTQPLTPLSSRRAWAIPVRIDLNQLDARFDIGGAEVRLGERERRPVAGQHNVPSPVGVTQW